MKTLRLLPLAAAVSLIFGCGGGGGGDVPTTTASSTGTLVDGYVSGATVVCDTNGNGVQDAGEASTTTNATGDFSFSPACGASIFASGGTNVDTGLPLVGLLKAPAGATMVTPLTTLVASGMTTAQVAEALGLPAGTNVTTADPMKDVALQKATLVVQQVMQKTAETLASLAGSTDVNGIYAGVAAAVADTLSTSGTPLVDNGVIDPALVGASVAAAVTEVGATNPEIGALDPTNVAAVSSAAITSQAQSIADAADVVAVAAAQQSDTSLQDNVALLEPLLTDAAAAGANGHALTGALATIGGLLETALTAPVGTNVIGDAIAVAAATTTADTSAVVVPDLTPTDYLSLTSGITVGGAITTLADFKANGVTVPGTDFAVLNVSFAFGVNGSVVDDPATADVETSKTVQVAAEVKDPAGARLMQVMVNQVVLTQAGGTLTATIPVGAQAQIYAVTASGATTSITLNNLAANSVSISGSTAYLNLGDLLSAALSSMTIQQQDVINAAMAATGTFDAKVAINKVDVRDALSSPANTLLDPVSVVSTGNTAINVVGLGVAGKVTR
jgi:hypothetical protein